MSEKKERMQGRKETKEHSIKGKRKGRMKQNIERKKKISK